MCSRRHGGGRVRSTTPAEDRYIVLSAKRNRRTAAQQMANQFLAASGKQISRKTVARRLRGGGLYARRPVVCVPLTRQHRTARLQWCREHHNWTEQDWACVLFSDESRFSLSSDCRRQLIWRESGTAYRPENIQEKDRYPTCSIMVWAGIMINGRTRLHVVANGTMTGQRYIDEVLLPPVRLFRGAVDLNPIENVWDALGRQVAGRNYPPTNKNTLIRALTEEWDKLPQQLLDNVVQRSSTRREFTSYKPAFLQAARKLAQCTHRTRLKAAFKKALEKVDSAGDFTRHSPAFERFRLTHVYAVTHTSGVEPPKPGSSKLLKQKNQFKGRLWSSTALFVGAEQRHRLDPLPRKSRRITLAESSNFLLPFLLTLPADDQVLVEHPRLQPLPGGGEESINQQREEIHWRF
ncbi:transposable element Tcb1 transposase [Trichonephila clavipes]|nr:transposable element Tcb1 transposase [Trichonephila clavipes]